MLRPTGTLAQLDALQCICPRIASQTARTVSRRPRRLDSRNESQCLHTPRQQQMRSTTYQNNSSTTPANQFSGERSWQPRPVASGKPYIPRIATLGNDGTSSSSPSSSSPQNRFRPPDYSINRNNPRFAPKTSAQVFQAPEDDHGDAQNGNPPVTGHSNPVYTRLIRRMLDLANQGSTAQVFNHAKMMAEKGYAPTIEAYTYLIQACASPANGINLQDTALRLLQELKQEGMKPTSTIFHHLLRIFSRSPDYLSMAAVMTEMKELGIAVDNEGWQCVIQHYLVTGQLERAMDVYEERREKRERIGYNTYMDIMKELGRVGEVDEAIKVMGDFTAEWGSVGNNVIQPIAWYELLNITASNYHLSGVQYVWKKAVQNPLNGTKPLNVDDGLCLKVLNTAARHGSPKLALEVFRMLTLRGATIGEPHYAALIGSHSRVGDFPNAFRTLAFMRSSGVNPTNTTAKSIVDVLVGDKIGPLTEAVTAASVENLRIKSLLSRTPDEASQSQLLAELRAAESALSDAQTQLSEETAKRIKDVDSAFFILNDFHERNDKEHDGVDVSALNAVLEACIRLKDIEKGLGCYSSCASLGVRPTLQTFNILFAGCAQMDDPVQAKEFAGFLAGEMNEMGLAPDVTSFEELLKIELGQADFDTAFVYLEQMKPLLERQGLMVRPVIYELLARRLEENGDRLRWKMVVDEMRECGYNDYVEILMAGKMGEVEEVVKEAVAEGGESEGEVRTGEGP